MIIIKPIIGTQIKNPAETTSAIKYVILQVVIVNFNLLFGVDLLRAGVPSFGVETKSQFCVERSCNGFCLGCEFFGFLCSGEKKLCAKIRFQHKEDWWKLIMVPCLIWFFDENKKWKFEEIWQVHWGWKLMFFGIFPAVGYAFFRSSVGWFYGATVST